MAFSGCYGCSDPPPLYKAAVFALFAGSTAGVGVRLADGEYYATREQHFMDFVCFAPKIGAFYCVVGGFVLWF